MPSRPNRRHTADRAPPPPKRHWQRSGMGPRVKPEDDGVDVCASDGDANDGSSAGGRRALPPPHDKPRTASGASPRQDNDIDRHRSRRVTPATRKKRTPHPHSASSSGSDPRTHAKPPQPPPRNRTPLLPRSNTATAEEWVLGSSPRMTALVERLRTIGNVSLAQASGRTHLCVVQRVPDLSGRCAQGLLLFVRPRMYWRVEE